MILKSVGVFFIAVLELKLVHRIFRVPLFEFGQKWRKRSEVKYESCF